MVWKRELTFLYGMVLTNNFSIYKIDFKKEKMDNSFYFKNVHLKKEIVNLEDYVTKVGNKRKRKEF
jgi:hypothetical protein